MGFAGVEEATGLGSEPDLKKQLRVQGSRNSGFRVVGLTCGAKGLEFGVWRVRLQLKVLGSRV